MRNSSFIVRAGSLAALVVGLGAFAVPAFATVTGPDQSFPQDGVAMRGMSNVPMPMASTEGFTAIFSPAVTVSPGCEPITTHLRNGDTLVRYPARC
jgi:hypothetical protein